MVVPKRVREEEEGDCVEVLVTELKKRGMVVDRVVGLADEFLKVGPFFHLSLPKLPVICDHIGFYFKYEVSILILCRVFFSNFIRASYNSRICHTKVLI